MPQTSMKAALKNKKDKPHTSTAKELAIAFVSAVTESSGPHDWIAKNGNDSVFALLQRLHPEVCSNRI